VGYFAVVESRSRKVGVIKTGGAVAELPRLIVTIFAV
jgi:hypothetical protein